MNCFLDLFNRHNQIFGCYLGMKELKRKEYQTFTYVIKDLSKIIRLNREWNLLDDETPHI